MTTASVPSDGSSVSLGTTPTVTSTAPNFGQAPPLVDQPSTNALFTAAQQDVPSAAPSSRASAFSSILAPCVGEDFTNGIAQSEAGIGPQAIVDMIVDLTGIATDPSGDPITHRVVGDQHATATISADGTSLLFSPDDGYTGEATFTLVADDGFAQSAQATIDVEVSSAPLVHIDFDQSRILFSAAGATDLIHVYADFADQTGVLVPLDYVNAQIDGSTVATLTPDGLLTSIANGYTVLRAERGTVAAATVVGVGTPSDGEQDVANLYNINPYPASVTLIPAGATRSIITMLGTLPDTFVGPADGVKYISENTAIATVDANGIITAIADGFVDIKVLWTYGEGVVHVRAARRPSAVRGLHRDRPGEAGDLVHAGDVLATLDDHDLQLDRVRWQSERERLVLKSREAMAKHDPGTIGQLDAQLRETDAQAALTAEKLSRTRITAPIDGMLVSGDLSQSIGAPVEMGKVLYEVAPLDQYRVIVRLDEHDIRYVKPGQSGHVLLHGMTGDRVPFTVQRVYLGRGDRFQPQHIPRRGYARWLAARVATGHGRHRQDRHWPAFLHVGMDPRPDRLGAHAGLELDAVRQSITQPQVHTDPHRSGLGIWRASAKALFLSVCISVHPWLIFAFFLAATTPMPPQKAR